MTEKTEIIIEETLSQKGIVVLSVKSKRLYARVKKMSDSEIKELQKYGIVPSFTFYFDPISTDEMRVNGISETLIEESLNSEYEKNEHIMIEG